MAVYQNFRNKHRMSDGMKKVCVLFSLALVIIFSCVHETQNEISSVMSEPATNVDEDGVKKINLRDLPEDSQVQKMSSAHKEKSGGMEEITMTGVEEVAEVQMSRRASDVNVDLSVLSNFAEVWATPKITEGTEFPMFWNVPVAGGDDIKQILGKCYKLTLATEAGQRHVGDSISRFEIDDINYLNVNPYSKEGIEHAKSLGIISSDIYGVVFFSPFVHEMATLFTLAKKGRIFALLRNPLDRAIAVYHRTQASDPKYAGLSIDEFYMGFDAAPFENNWMTRFLSNKKVGPLTKGDLDRAKGTLERKVLIGLSDQMQESLRRFKSYLGLISSETDLKCEKSFFKPYNSMISDEVKRGTELWHFINNHNYFDARLYEYAQNLFYEQIAVIKDAEKNVADMRGNMKHQSSGFDGVKEVYANYADVWTDRLRPDRAAYPLFWNVPEAGGNKMKLILGHCHRVTVATEESDKIPIKLLTNFRIEDVSHVQGLERASVVIPGPPQVVFFSPFVYDVGRIFSNEQKGRIFTILRHPVDRAVAIARSKMLEKHLGMTVEQFYMSNDSVKVVNNWLIRFLLNKKTDKVTERDLTVAKDILQHKVVVGLADQFEESLRRFKNYMGWISSSKQESCEHTFIKPYESSEVMEGSDVWNHIAHENKFDMELYKYARMLFNEQGYR